MKKIVLFPFHHDIETLLKDMELLIDTEITGIISYNEDSPFIEKLCSAYGIANRSYDELLNECDAVLILDNYREYSQNKYYSVIDDANRLGKEVLITPLAASQIDLSDYEGKYSLLKKEPCDPQEIERRYDMDKREKLYDLEIPAVGIMGQGINCGKFECQKLVNNVLSTECKTAVLSTNALGALYGYYTMPDFMYSSLSFNEKVLKFNLYIRMIVKTENPDIIIVGMPEGVAPFEKRIFNSFGEYPLVITSAISLDTTILCTYFLQGELIEGGVEEIMAMCEERFRIPMGAVCISDVYLEIPEAELSETVYEFLDEDFVLRHRSPIDGSSAPIFDTYNEKRAEAIIRSLIEPMSENIKLM